MNVRRAIRPGGLLLLLCWGIAGAHAQELETSLSVGSATGLSGSLRSIEIEAATTSDADVTAWSFSLCHDDTVAVPCSGEWARDDAVECALWIDEDGARGYQIFDGTAPPTLGSEHPTTLVTVDYELAGQLGDSGSLWLCNSVDVPTVINSLEVDGDDVGPATNDGTITIDAVDPVFFFRAHSDNMTVVRDDPDSVFLVEIEIEEHADSPAGPNPTYAFSMGLRHTADLLEVLDVVPAGGLGELHDGDGPDFFSSELFDDGWTLGTIYSLTATVVTLEFTEPTIVAEIDYRLAPDATIPEAAELLLTRLEWDGAFTDPPIDNVVVISSGGSSETAETPPIDLTIELVGTPFRRGDCNEDGEVGLVDALLLLQALYLDGSIGGCDKACDSNDDGFLGITDPVALLMHLFSGGTPPPAPYDACGEDPTDDGLDCEAYDAC